MQAQQVSDTFLAKSKGAHELHVTYFSRLIIDLGQVTGVILEYSGIACLKISCSLGPGLPIPYLHPYLVARVPERNVMSTRANI